MKKQNEDKLVKIALEINQERKLWKLVAYFSVVGAIVSTVGFMIAVRGGI